jgi:hypothetical protein
MKEFLNKEVVSKIINDNEFSDVLLNCPECISIEDDQYTCSTCFVQGGNQKYKANDLLKIAYKYKYNKDFKDDSLSLESLKNIVSFGYECTFLDLHYNDYKVLIDDDFFEIKMGWVTVELETIFDYLLENKI